jgi:hypothetical protein
MIHINRDLNLIQPVRQIIVEEMIAPYAHQIGVNATDVILPLILNAGLRVGVKDSGAFLRCCITRAAMTKARTSLA